MLKEKNLPLELWAEAVNTCVYVLNRSYTKSLNDETPYEKWSGRKPYVDHLRVFGSVVHVKSTRKLNKLEDRSTVMIVIGYERGKKAYRCLDPMNFKVTISMDVIFEESQSWDFSQQRGQRLDLTLTSTINLVNPSEVSTKNHDSSCTSIVPTQEQRDQDQSSEEDRPERFRSVQEIYDETQVIEDDEAYFFLWRRTYVLQNSNERGSMEKSNERRVRSNRKERNLGACETAQEVQINWYKVDLQNKKGMSLEKLQDLKPG